jgi:hypothetical protein
MKNIHVLQENIYVTSDEEIKESDFFIYRCYKVCKCTGLSLNKQILTDNEIAKHKDYGKPQGLSKKIILTTDQNLIKDGVQAIDDEFLEWFVKHPSCESVEVKPLLSNNGRALFGYKIIIPKKEPKQSAVEWLIDELLNGKILMPTLINQANEMFKQQAIDAHFEGVKTTVFNISKHIDIPKTLKNVKEIENGIQKNEDGEDYYNETFNK